MKIKELKEIISELPDDMEVCGSGHFGEKLELFYAEVRNVGTGAFGDKGSFSAFVISLEDSGPEPD